MLESELVEMALESLEFVTRMASNYCYGERHFEEADSSKVVTLVARKLNGVITIEFGGTTHEFVSLEDSMSRIGGGVNGLVQAILYTYSGSYLKWLERNGD